jgi:hypothetical protein
VLFGANPRDLLALIAREAVPQLTGEGHPGAAHRRPREPEAPTRMEGGTRNGRGATGRTPLFPWASAESGGCTTISTSPISPGAISMRILLLSGADAE